MPFVYNCICNCMKYNQICYNMHKWGMQIYVEGGGCPVFFEVKKSPVFLESKI